MGSYLAHVVMPFLVADCWSVLSYCLNQQVGIKSNSFAIAFPKESPFAKMQSLLQKKAVYVTKDLTANYNLGSLILWINCSSFRINSPLG